MTTVETMQHDVVNNNETLEALLKAFRVQDGFDKALESYFSSKEDALSFFRNQFINEYEQLIEDLNAIGSIWAMIPFLEIGNQKACKEKIELKLYSRLTKHDSELLMEFETRRDELFSACENLLKIMAYIKSETYEEGTLVTMIRPIFKGIYTMLDENQDSVSNYNLSNPFIFYCNDEFWDIDYLDDYVPLHKLISFIPGNTLQCAVMYKPEYINKTLSKLKHYKLKQVLSELYLDLI